MYIYNVIAQYTLSAVAAIICLVLILIQGKAAFNLPVYKAALMFTVNIMLISLLSWGMFCQETIFNAYTVSLPVRLLDYVLYSILPFTWMALISSLCKEIDTAFHSVAFTAAKILSSIILVIFSVITLFFMDDYYHLETFPAQIIYLLTEAAFALISILIFYIAIFAALKTAVLSFVRRFIQVTTGALSLYFIAQVFMAKKMVTAEQPTWATGFPDFSGWMLFAVNIITVYFIYKKDFQKLYSKPSETSPISSIESVINTIAEDHHLTIREREIVELIYQGYSNAQIAEALFISFYTVKTHIKNIYEKMDVSSRMELSYVINRQLYMISK